MSQGSGNSSYLNKNSGETANKVRIGALSGFWTPTPPTKNARCVTSYISTQRHMSGHICKPGLKSFCAGMTGIQIHWQRHILWERKLSAWDDNISTPIEPLGILVGAGDRITAALRTSLSSKGIEGEAMEWTNHSLTFLSGGVNTHTASLYHLLSVSFIFFLLFRCIPSASLLMSTF